MKTTTPLRAVWRRIRRDDRGAALAFVAVSVLALLGMTALAIDLGMLFEARNEAQRSADAAALAGASALVSFGNDPGVESEAIARAQEYAAENPVQGEPPSVEPTDVQVDLAEWRVTVTVHRTAERGNPVPTRLARVLGFESVDVTGRASAEAVEAGGVNCLLPLAIPDRWEDVNNDGAYDPDDGDYYIPWELGMEPGEYTGYGPAFWGQRIVIKPFKNTGQMNESWYYPWRPPGQSGAADYRENISGCVDPDQTYTTGQEVDTEPGAMIGPTKQGFQDLIDQDPGSVSWNSDNDCLVWDSPSGSQTSGCIESSPRLRTAPMFDPTEAPDPGAKPFTFRNFASVFVDEIVGNEVYAYIMPGSGVAPADPDGENAGPNKRIVQLVE
jgi:hypothetical protein